MSEIQENIRSRERRTAREKLVVTISSVALSTVLVGEISRVRRRNATQMGVRSLGGCSALLKVAAELSVFEGSCFSQRRVGEGNDQQLSAQL